MGWRMFVAALDAGTMVCAAFNAAYFLRRLREEPLPARVLALVVLAVISLGALLEASALLAMAAKDDDGAMLDSAAWGCVRALVFAGALGVSGLISRRLAAR